VVVAERLDELDQDAARAARMDERHQVPVGARTGGPVDQVEAQVGKVLEGGLDVLDAVGDMVEAGASFLEEPAHGAVRSHWLEQFEPGIPGPDEADRYTLVLNGFDRRPDTSSHGLERGQYRVDGLDRHGYVVEGETL
jgi:hypothetical protein